MLPPDRRSFLARLSGALALLTTGTTDIVASESNGKRPSVRQPVRPSEWDDSWLEGLTTGHKQIFDIPFARPRTLQLKRDPKFLEIEDAIWQLIEEESGRLNMVLAPN